MTWAQRPGSRRARIGRAGDALGVRTTIDDATAVPGAGAVVGAAGRGLGSVSAAVARLRAARPLHPVGVVLAGRLVRAGSPPGDASGVPWLDSAGDDDVVVRLSRGGGLPAWAPDVHGLALRHTDDGRRVDVLLSSTGSAPLARHVLAPRRALGGGTYTCLLPYRGPRGPVMLAARPSPPRALPAEPAAIARELAAEPWRVVLAWADGVAGRWRTFARLVVGGPPATSDASRPSRADVADARPDQPVRFDPLHAPPGLTAYPWVAALREPAYAAARAAVPLPAPVSAQRDVPDPDERTP